MGILKTERKVQKERKDKERKEEKRREKKIKERREKEKILDMEKRRGKS